MEYLDLNVPPLDADVDAWRHNWSAEQIEDELDAGPDKKRRRQGRKKPPGEREEGVEDLDAAFREGPFANYLAKHGHHVLRIRDLLQRPREGLFTWKDILWDLEETESNTKPDREGEPPVI